MYKKCKKIVASMLVLLIMLTNLNVIGIHIGEAIAANFCIIKPFCSFMLKGTNLFIFACTYASDKVFQFKLKSNSFSIS